MKKKAVLSNHFMAAARRNHLSVSVSSMSLSKPTFHNCMDKNKPAVIAFLFQFIPLLVLLSRHEKAAAVCRRDGGIIVAHAHRALRGSIPISHTFTAHVFECISIPLESVSSQQFSGLTVA